MFEINPSLVERELVIPKLRQIFDQIKVKKKVGITHISRLLKENFSEIIVGKKGVFYRFPSNRRETTIDIISFVCNCCFPSNSLEYDEKRHDKFIEKFGGEEEKIYSIHELTIRSPVMKELAEIGGFMSIGWLERIYRFYLTLSKEHEGAPKSLENLLN